MVNFKLDKRLISNRHKPLIIAEIGINHEGQLWKAKKMVDDAHSAGCECVKFQYHIPEEEMIKNNTIHGNEKESIWDIIKRCSLTETQEIELFEYVKKKNLIYLSTPFSKKAAKKLYQMMDRVQQRRAKTVGKNKIAINSGAYKEVDGL
jgi:N-acetylneuraminate synthase